MTGASLLHTQLLHQAKLLAKKEPKKPRQASLRRSISTSYFAVFHFLTYRAARRLVGASHQLKSLRSLVRRAFEHGEMKSACKSFKNGRGGLPDSVEDAMTPVDVPRELTAIATNFVELQNARHQADYDLSDSFRRREALQYFEQARTSIKDLWPVVSSHDATQFFLISLVSWRKIRR